MARKNKDLEILVKLVTQGNFDEAQKQLERLKTGHSTAAASATTSLGKMSGAWKAWTALATTSASAMRKAWLTALGPISAIIVVLQTLKSMFGFIFTAVQRYRKAQEETNKTVQEASDALQNATNNKNKYANAQGIERLSQAIKAHSQDLELIAKKNDEIAKKTAGAGQQWFNILGLVSANNRKLMEQLPALAQAEIELKKEVRAKEEALELTKKQEEAEKKRATAQEAISKRMDELTLGETELKIKNIERQMEEYRKAGVSEVEIAKLRNLEIDRINKERTEKELQETERKNAAVEALERNLDQRIAALDGESLEEKISINGQEEAAEIKRLEKEFKGHAKLEEMKAKVTAFYRAKDVKDTQTEVKMKTAAALEIADVSLQALATLNAMGELKSKEDARRAKFLLALEKSIAIAKAIAAAQSAGPLAAGIAAAQIALITAQFAAQSKAIDQAQEASSQGAMSVGTDTPLPGGLGTLHEEFGGPSGGGRRSGGFSGAPSSGGSGGPNITISIGNIPIYFSTDHLDLSERQTVLRALREEVISGTVEGVKTAAAFFNVGQKNRTVAI